MFLSVEAHLLVEGRDGFDRWVSGVDVNPLFCVGVEVQQSSYEVLDKAQGLTGHVPGFELQQQHERKMYLLHNLLYSILNGWAALMT